MKTIGSFQLNRSQCRFLLAVILMAGIGAPKDSCSTWIWQKEELVLEQ